MVKGGVGCCGGGLGWSRVVYSCEWSCLMHIYYEIRPTWIGFFLIIMPKNEILECKINQIVQIFAQNNIWSPKSGLGGFAGF